MFFGLDIDGVVLLYVAHRLALARGSDPVTAIAGPSTSMLLGMWTTAATFYGLMFVDFPSLQQLGALIGHSMMVVRHPDAFLVPALLAAATPTYIRALTMPRLAGWIAPDAASCSPVRQVMTCLLGFAAVHARVNPTLERLRSVTDAAASKRIGSAFGLPTSLRRARRRIAARPLLQTNERLTERIAVKFPRSRFSTSPAPAVGGPQARQGHGRRLGMSPAT